MRLALLACAALSLTAAEISKGFDHFYNLEYEQAIAEFEKEIQLRPNDPFSFTHLAEALLYREMFRAGALESELVSGNNFFLAKAKIIPPEAEQRRFDAAIDSAIRRSEAQLARNEQDTEALYALGVAHGLRANYNFLIRKLWRDSLKEFTLSRKLHQRALQIRPDFVDAMMVGGVHDYIVGSLPFTWKMLGFLIGFRGDKEGGLRTVERVAAEGDRARVEAMVLLAVAYRRERHAEKAVPLLEKLIAMFPRHYLYRLEMVQMYADQGKKEEALRVLKTMEDMRTAGVRGYKNLPGGKIYYARGNLLFWYRDYALAIPDLRRAIDGGATAGLNTLLNAWLRLGQCQDMLGRRDEAVRAYREAIDGSPDSDAAREARKYLSSAYRRN
ncbi:MAG TPA: tetratricopeptide repeat protein [Bryobacteraceae bacterium]|nr:tetratricopeptide repeat protein [Bryobacteraceae bacterium]